MSVGNPSLGNRALERVRREAARHGYQPEPGERSENSHGFGMLSGNRKSQKRSREPLAIGEVLNTYYSSRSVARKLVLPQILESWTELVGELVAQHSTPQALENDILYVSTDSTVWAAQLSALSYLVIEKINQLVGADTIVTMQVSGPKANVPNYGPRTAKGRIGYRDTFG